MPRNPYFTMGTTYEELILEDLIVESINIYGQDLFYIPRTLVAPNKIFGEDRLSEFKQKYPVVCYFEDIDNFSNNNFAQSKFGFTLEQSATLSIARREWEYLVGRFGDTIIPERPCEGDLLYFPLTGGLFEIKFVTHQDPFYQLGKLYLWKLQVELFQYGSEHIDTGEQSIDFFEELKSFDETINEVEVSDNYGNNSTFKEKSNPIIFDTNNPFGDL